MTKVDNSNQNGNMTQELAQTQAYSIQDVSNPEKVLNLANVIKEYATQNGLVENIKGKPYPMVEAWQYAGSLVGLFPVVVEVENVSTETEMKYKSIVEVIERATGKVVGRGWAICSNKESKKKYFEEYAICSMAQTRATGKAFRLLIGWIFKAAGYEPTPAEEMEEFDKTDQSAKANVVIAEYKLFALRALSACDTATDVKELSEIATMFHKDAEFIDKTRDIYKNLINAGK